MCYDLTFTNCFSSTVQHCDNWLNGKYDLLEQYHKHVDGNLYLWISLMVIVLASVIYSSAMGGMWLTNVTEVSIMNGLAVTDLNLSMRKNDDIDHEEIYLRSRPQRYQEKRPKTGESRADVDIVLVLEDGSFYPTDQ